jgi:ABC-type multidrug transport system fused ATPase/permease subunit
VKAFANEDSEITKFESFSE